MRREGGEEGLRTWYIVEDMEGEGDGRDEREARARTSP